MADGGKVAESSRAQYAQATPAGYMPGFGNDFETEALPGALPVGQNSPQRTRLRPLRRAALGLALHGAARHQRALLALPHPPLGAARASGSRRRRCPTGRPAPCLGEHDRPIGQLRWGPVPIPKEKLTFLTGLRTMTTSGDVNTQAGMAAHVYLVTQSMENDYFYNADGEMLIVPQQGSIAVLHRVRQDRGGARRDLRHPARRQVQGRADRRPGARLRVRELRRQVHAARPRADRRQLPRQRARLQDAGGGLRGQGGGLAG